MDIAFANEMLWSSRHVECIFTIHVQRYLVLELIHKGVVPTSLLFFSHYAAATWLSDYLNSIFSL